MGCRKITLLFILMCSFTLAKGQSYKNNLQKNIAFINKNLIDKNLFVILSNSTMGSDASPISTNVDYHIKDLIKQFINKESYIAFQVTNGEFANSYQAILVQNDVYEIFVLSEVTNKRNYYKISFCKRLATNDFNSKIVIDSTDSRQFCKSYKRPLDSPTKKTEFIFLDASAKFFAKLYQDSSEKSKLIVSPLGKYYRGKYELLAHSFLPHKIGIRATNPCVRCPQIVRYDYLYEYWYKIKVTNSLSGWIQGRFTKEGLLYASSESNDIVVKIHANTFVYNRPGSHLSIGILNTGQIRAVFARQTIDKNVWYKVRFDDKLGWIKLSNGVKVLFGD